MKLLLADGTAVAVKSYETTNTTINGNTVDAISIMVQKTTLEKVKTLFGDSDNLTAMHMYNDENILIDTLNGYQIRKSIALGDDDTSFVVLLAKSSEVNEQLVAIRQDITSLTDGLKELKTAVETVTGSVTEVSKNADDAVKKYNEQAKTIQTMTESVNKAVETVSDQATAIDNLEIAVNKIKESFTAFADTAAKISSQYTAMVDGVNSTNINVTNAITKIDAAYNKLVSKTDEFAYLNDLVNEIKELATGNDEKVINYTDTVSTLTEGVNQSKLAVEQFNEKLTTVVKDVDDVTKSVDATNAAVTKASKDIGDVSNKVATLAEKAEDAEETASSLEERVVALEPITDYTTLSLDEAKKYRINESKLKLATYLEDHPITSTCHGGEAAQYSITSEKQSFLQAMIAMTTIAQASGLEYQPSWNRVGESCTYDWTLTELQQLAIEIEATVRPLVSHQQALEKEILNVNSMTGLKAVDISYDAIKPNVITKKETTEDCSDTEETTAEKNSDK